jgi:peptidoglycan-associated lipoprotein
MAFREGMKMSFVKRSFTLFAVLVFALLMFACGGGTTTTPPPAAPTASLSVDPANITQGGSTTLTWRTTNATDVSIDALGAVQPNG